LSISNSFIQIFDSQTAGHLKCLTRIQGEAKFSSVCFKSQNIVLAGTSAGSVIEVDCLSGKQTKEIKATSQAIR